jgi:hypothetical protein
MLLPQALIQCHSHTLAYLSTTSLGAASGQVLKFVVIQPAGTSVIFCNFNDMEVLSIYLVGHLTCWLPNSYKVSYMDLTASAVFGSLTSTTYSTMLIQLSWSKILMVVPPPKEAQTKGSCPVPYDSHLAIGEVEALGLRTLSINRNDDKKPIHVR